MSRGRPRSLTMLRIRQPATVVVIDGATDVWFGSAPSVAVLVAEAFTNDTAAPEKDIPIAAPVEAPPQ